MAEEKVDMEYNSLHGYIRSTPSDTKVHAEHQLRENRSTRLREKNTQNHEKLGRMEELGGNTGVLVGLDLPSPVGELKQGSDRHGRAVV